MLFFALKYLIQSIKNINVEIERVSNLDWVLISVWDH